MKKPADAEYRRMSYGGLNEGVWRGKLGEKSLVLRLTALRALSSLGEVGARALLTGPSFQQPDLSYPWVWALCRCVDADLFRVIRLSGHPAQSLLARARFLLLRDQRQPQWRGPKSRLECIQAMVDALHPQETLACAVRLLEQHGEHAIPALLDLIRLRPPELDRQLGLLELYDEKAECAAWALGQLGRVTLPEIVEEYRHASTRVRQHLAMALWYLGPSADKAVPLLVRDKSRQAHAALVALEHRASLAMIKARRGPVWLDAEAVSALALIAFSNDDREYAAGCLGGFGPAADKTMPILNHLAQDPDEGVRFTLARGLGWGGRAEAVPLLLKLRNFDASKRVRDRALATLETFRKWQEFGREALFRQVLVGDEKQRQLALSQLADLGLPPERDSEIDELLHRVTDGLDYFLVALANTRPFPPVDESILLTHLAADSPGVRSAAARCVRLLPRTKRTRKAWLARLNDSDAEVVREAVEALAEERLGLKALGLTAADLRKIPTGALALLLAETKEVITPNDLLPLFERTETEVKVAAATALGLLGKTHKRVLQALLDGLSDPARPVALACCRALLQLGQRRWGWHLIYSENSNDQSLALEVLQEMEELPQPLIHAFRTGLLIDHKIIELFRAKLTTRHFLDLLTEVLPGLTPKLSEKLVRGFAGAGLSGLDRMPEMLGHSDANVRQCALSALELILRSPLDIYQEWMADRGLVLPLRQASTFPRLAQIVMEFLRLCRAWANPRLGAILCELAACADPSVAAHAVAALGRAYAAQFEPMLARAILLAFHHPRAVVRVCALRTATSSLPTSFWGQDPGPHLESHLLHRAADFAENRLEKAQLLEALRWIARLESDVELFVPQDPRQVGLLVQLLAYPDVSERVMTLLWRYAGPLDLSTWRTVLRAAANPAVHPRRADLVQRWPRLIVSALAYRRDGVEWVSKLGQFADKGLLLALSHRSPTLRRRALHSLEPHHCRQALKHRLLQMSNHDPVSEIRTAALLQLAAWGYE